jgi:tellurite resistance protein TehA-like permease
MPTASPLRDLSPNWFATVMGTGIVANASVLLPVSIPGLRALATVAWLAAALLLVTLLALTAVQCRREPARLRRHLEDATMAPFLGMPPMALLTVGAGALLVGHDVIGARAALDVAVVLWVAGTLTGLAAYVVVPTTLLRRRHLRDAPATWLLPLVPPMVSAATGAALIAHLPAGDARVALLLTCWVLFALSLAASAPLIVLVATRVLRRGPGEARMVPTLWIVLGPLGQSITAANLLGAAATNGSVPHAAALTAFGVRYGIAALALAMAWLAVAAALTLRTARRDHLPFTLTWWSFTFPVGTCVTGTSELAIHSAAGAFTPIALALFAFLTAAWATTATRTVGGLLSLRAAPTSPTTPSPAPLAPRPAR